MKQLNYSILTITALALCIMLAASCRKNLLDQSPTTNPLPDHSGSRNPMPLQASRGSMQPSGPVFDRDYYFDGQADYFRCRGNSTTTGNLRLGDAYQSTSTANMFAPSGYGQYSTKCINTCTELWTAPTMSSTT